LIIFGFHNYKMEQNLKGHILNSRLNAEKKEFDDEMTGNMV